MGYKTTFNIKRAALLRQAKTLHRFYATKQQIAKKPYTDTILLPQTKFMAKHLGEKRIQMDEYLQKECRLSELYDWQRENLKGPDFILHDGPPYANGDPHIGHAINKILKDITIRSKVIKGQRVHYVPGWDCHGLPIELKAFSDLNIQTSKLSPLQIRERAKKFAEEAISKQREVFRSWGVMANWENEGCYFTNNASYVTNELNKFVTLYEKNLVFRDFKPVYWSPSSRTALAESELEYNANHQSKCATVRFRLTSVPPILEEFRSKPIYALSWTTTPWTLVANQALAYASNASYTLAEDQWKNYYIIATDLVEQNAQKIGPLRTIMTFLGSDLQGAEYSHPMTRISLPFLPAKHVTTDVGTGLVHTAPAHGADDFIVALDNKMPIISLVNEDGCYTAETGAALAGLNVLDGGSRAVLQFIENDVMHTEEITHSYPYDWRTKKPIIVRASHQWFIDTNSLKEKAIESLSNVNIFPEHNRVAWTNELMKQVSQRPYWCISRQRVWGTPIPVLYEKDSLKIITNREWVNHLCETFQKFGTDCWWDLPVEKLVTNKLLEDFKIDSSEIQKGQDILDIWFDSGISWSTVLPEGKADIYMEGIDQFNGWFQSSLLTSIALQGCAPYKNLFVHGFAVDKDNNKMSKSLGNVVDPQVIIKGGNDKKVNPSYGVDVLRWWVASHAAQHNQIPMKDSVLAESDAEVKKLRLVFRYMLSVLHRHSTDFVEPQFKHLDLYMFHRLHQYHNQIQRYYEEYQFHRVSRTINNFIVNDVSSVYCHIIKDLLYCDKVDSPFREGAMQVVSNILETTVKSVAPILPHLAEEILLHHPENQNSSSVFHTVQTVPESWKNEKIETIVNKALEIKRIINKQMNNNTWNGKAVIIANSHDHSLLSVLQDSEFSRVSELCDIWQVSSVTLQKEESFTETKVRIETLTQPLCQRCRRHTVEDRHTLCERCTDIVNIL